MFSLGDGNQNFKVLFTQQLSDNKERVELIQAKDGSNFVIIDFSVPQHIQSTSTPEEVKTGTSRNLRRKVVDSDFALESSPIEAEPETRRSRRVKRTFSEAYDDPSSNQENLPVQNTRQSLRISIPMSEEQQLVEGKRSRNKRIRFD